MNKDKISYSLELFLLLVNGPIFYLFIYSSHWYDTWVPHSTVSYSLLTRKLLSVRECNFEFVKTEKWSLYSLVPKIFGLFSNSRVYLAKKFQRLHQWWVESTPDLCPLSTASHCNSFLLSNNRVNLSALLFTCCIAILHTDNLI